MSTKSTNNHPGVWLLFPAKDVAEPKLVSKDDGHWVLEYRQDVTANGKKATMGIALTVVGTGLLAATLLYAGTRWRMSAEIAGPIGEGSGAAGMRLPFNEPGAFQRSFERIASAKYDKGYIEADGTVCIKSMDLPQGSTS